MNSAALRSLLRAPRFFVGATLVLALGVATTTVLFSIVNGVLLAPAALPDASRVVVLHRQNNSREADVSLPDIVDLRAGTKTLAAVGLFWNTGLDMQLGEQPSRVQAGLVDGGFFPATGVLPLVGRLLTGADEAAPVVVLDESLWRTRFAADPAVVGRALELSGVMTTIVGVAPASADLLGEGIALWAPVTTFAPWAPAARGANTFEAVARLAPGVSLADARAELEALTGAAAIEYPDTNRGKVLTAAPLVDFVTYGVGARLWLLFGAACAVLLIAVVNVSGMLLVRATRRTREFAVRAALGATTMRLARQLLAEGLWIGGAAMIVGLGLVVAGFGALKNVAAAQLPRADLITLDFTTLAVALAVSLGAALLASAATLWRIRASAAALHGTRAIGGGQRRPLRYIVSAELALAVVLSVGAALMLRSLWNLVQEPLGFEAGGVLTAHLVLPESRYSEPASQTAAVAGIVDALRSVPGVRYAAFVTGLPLGGATIGQPLVVDGYGAPTDRPPAARARPVHGEYFLAMGLAILNGRALDARDTAGSERVVVVNKAFASVYFPDQDPIGRRVAVRPGAATPIELGPQWMTVVGVAADVKSQSVQDADEVAIYYPYVQRDQAWIRFGELVIDVEGDPAGYVPAMHAAVQSVDPRVPLDQVLTLEQRVDRALSSARFLASLMIGFGALALALAMQGLFAVVAYSVAQMRAEIALRIMLGATRAHAVRFALNDGARAIALGVVAGTTAAFLGAGALEAHLFGVSARDPVTVAAIAVLLAAVALLAAWVPARSASRIAPMEALRDE